MACSVFRSKPEAEVAGRRPSSSPSSTTLGSSDETISAETGSKQRASTNRRPSGSSSTSTLRRCTPNRPGMPFREVVEGGPDPTARPVRPDADPEPADDSGLVPLDRGSSEAPDLAAHERQP